MLYSKLFLEFMLLSTMLFSNSVSFVSNSLSLTNRPNTKHKYYMSISDKYLNDLQNGIQKNIKIEKDLEKRLHRAQVTNQTELFPESIYVNMNKMNSIFFNRKSTSIIFTSTRLLEEIYVYNKDRKSTRLNSSHMSESRMPSSA